MHNWGLRNLHSPRGWKPRVTSRVKLALRFTLLATVTHAHRWVISRNRSPAQGLIGLGFTNASPVVAAPGGKSRVIGTNPIACSVPNGQGGMAMHFDFSTSAVALGKITMAKYAGEKIPFGWAVDENGNPTDDPEAALKGSLCSAGGYKGWGFGLLAELMASAMTGSVNSLDVGGLKLADGPPHRLGQTYIIMDTTTFGDQFGERFQRLADAIAEDEGARIPGAQRDPMTTVNVDDALWQKITDLGNRS
jgi:(2R)-3-sulfolactate dehydrogenase (NADP+)